MSLKTHYGLNDTDEEMSLDLLGGKGYNQTVNQKILDKIGLKIPPARIITTAVCRTYQKAPKETMREISVNAVPEIVEALRDETLPPLFSVRSGAKVSMPGMMDTILNVGLTRDAIPTWEKLLGARATWDSRRRLLQMYGSVVFGVDGQLFEKALTKEKEKKRAKEDRDLDAASLRAVAEAFEKILQKEGHKMPEDVEGQICGAIEAVFKSWNNERAKYYRKINNIPDDWGTAAIVQRMVMGNLNDNSCSGVLFTRNPSTGRQEIIGEFLPNAQGEDVVAGVRTPQPFGDLLDWSQEVYEKLKTAARELETHWRDMQDIEFTVQNGEVYLLQTRSGKRSAIAAAKIAIDMASAGRISKREALSRITLSQYNALNAPMIAPGYNAKPDAQGLAASTGIATAKAVFTSEAAVASQEPTILIAEETTPEDLPGIHAAAGVLTSTGGVTSHAAVVARGMDKVCVVGAAGIKIEHDKNGNPIGAKIGSHDVSAGDTLTIDGASGRVWIGSSVPVIDGGKLPEVEKLNEWIYDVFPVYKIVTKVDDIDNVYPTLFATYELDREDPDFIRSEVRDGLEYLNGVIDLSTMEELADPVDQQILALGGSALDDEAFAAKWGALMSYNGDKSQLKVYLGKRHAEKAEHARMAGYTVLEPLASLAKAKPNAAFFSLASEEQDAAKAFALARALTAPSGAVAASGSAPKELLDELAQAKSDQPEMEPFLALSPRQLMSSALKA
jgi:pyruvate, orthophosphate dikinase